MMDLRPLCSPVNSTRVWPGFSGQEPLARPRSAATSALAVDRLMRARFGMANEGQYNSRARGVLAYDGGFLGQSDDIDDLLGKVWGGRYQIQEFIGRGGMGMVFKARHLQMDRVVALKVIHRKLCQDEKQVQRFEQEARTSSKLHHPNSIRVYDYGTSDDGRLFMAMEFQAHSERGGSATGPGRAHRSPDHQEPR